MPDVFDKDPSAVLDYKWDWSSWLAAGETITTADVDLPPDGLTLDREVGHDTTSVTAWLAGGTVGKNYRVTAHITTSAGREDDRSLTIKVRDR